MYFDHDLVFFFNRFSNSVFCFGFMVLRLLRFVPSGPPFWTSGLPSGLRLVSFLDPSQTYLTDPAYVADPTYQIYATVLTQVG